MVSGPGGTLSLDGVKKNEVMAMMAKADKKCSCTDLKDCKKCLGKGTDCAWKITTGDNALPSKNCATAESKEFAGYACGLKCANVQKKGDGCNECLASQVHWQATMQQGQEIRETGSCINPQKPGKKKKKKKTSASINTSVAVPRKRAANILQQGNVEDADGSVDDLTPENKCQNTANKGGIPSD
eukprot:jgi/Psemu1/65629/estExt_Genemark1.C_1420003